MSFTLVAHGRIPDLLHAFGHPLANSWHAPPIFPWLVFPVGSSKKLSRADGFKFSLRELGGERQNTEFESTFVRVYLNYCVRSASFIACVIPIVQSNHMKPQPFLMECAALLFMCGCDLPPSGPVEVQPRPVSESKSASREGDGVRNNEHRAEISFDTAQDERFAEFVSKGVGSMVRKIAVGIEHRGVMRIELGNNTAPEDTLPLTKSLIAGARKDFPGKPITLKVFDPNGHAILTAHFHQYLVKVRLESACRVLAETNRTIASIAQEFGFHDHAHFTKTFHKHYGITPTAYRCEHQNPGLCSESQ